MKPQPDRPPPGGLQSRAGGFMATGWRFVPVTILMPLLASTVGLDGGPIFQIVAVENLGISAAPLGLAFGLGIISLPLQIAAARIPLRRARPNVQIFLVLTAIQAWILAVLVAIDATGGVAAIALAVTVTAELAVSILFATAWQPLLSFAVDPSSRQRLNSTWQAIARGVLAGSLVAFGALSDRWRPVFLVLVGIVAVAAAIGLRSVASPDLPRDDEGTIATDDPTPASRSSPDSLMLVFVVLGVANLGAMPLWLVYIDEVLWPSANLGLIGAVQIVAAMIAMLAWRPTQDDVLGRAMVAAIVTLAAACSIVFVPGPAPDRVGQAVILMATALTAIGITITRVSLLEQAHRGVNRASAVRVFTMLDVVASTSLQVGLLAAGFLITAATSTTGWIVDPYQLLIVAAAATTVLATHVLRTTQEPGRNRQSPR
ncbi:MAG: hypothetical protein ACR2QK_15245 [Acidimicrobiales bacterium]